MKRLIPAVIALMLLATAAYAITWFDGSLDAAKAKAQQEKKLILIDFSSLL